MANNVVNGEYAESPTYAHAPICLQVGMTHLRGSRHFPEASMKDRLKLGKR